MSFLQVLLQKCEVESMMHSPGDYILLSADKYEVKVTSKNIFSPLCISCVLWMPVPVKASVDSSVIRVRLYMRKSYTCDIVHILHCVSCVYMDV